MGAVPEDIKPAVVDTAEIEPPAPADPQLQAEQKTEACQTPPESSSEPTSETKEKE